MVTYVDFQPSDIAPFQFQAILDGTTYNIVLTYNFFGQRYYINIYTTQGALIVSKPLVGSPTGYDISMTAGYFTSTLVFRTQNNQFEISDTPISYPSFGVRDDWMRGTQG
ncbi:MAG TPA: hypothetical protein VFM18_23655, partial [Methanosarcina sp.]|nr:hypothetical protein [Methanosarcina sp.]